MQMWMKSAIIGLAVVAATGTVAGMAPGEAAADEVTVAPRELTTVLYNPFMGFAPPADQGPYRQPHKLVYAVVTWRELEPERGRYDFAGLERRFKLDEWGRQGVRVIFRFVADYATDKAHRDIPDWLYEEIGRDGIQYDEEVGKGFSPNYSNETFIQRHKEAIAALGARYDKDPRVAFIALGSLGHWGEWHTYSNDTMNIPFPPMATSDRYVKHYLEAFPTKRLLMRRPYPIAGGHGIGLYNDMFGSPGATADFVDWFENGYLSLLAGDVRLPGMPDFWKQAPSGGEFANAGQVRSYVQNGRVNEVLQMVERSHVSWLGPSSPAGLEVNAAEQANMDKLLKRMGYRLRVAELSYPESAVTGGEVPVSLKMRNDGVASFYYDWPLEVALVSGQGETVASERVTGLAQTWLPGETASHVVVRLPSRLPEGLYSLRLALVDPDTGRPGVEFAMEGKQADGRYELGSLQVRMPGALERLRAWLAGLGKSLT
ncbi:DUF4832 domain-containing protein [Paenibacillus chartarius]|uniref:DUF4832 domain-containing protein n=1 Tax=Paenibacillus chartarius TaxID=747481 RepID=A0ABV6DLH6_9BACL